MAASGAGSESSAGAGFESVREVLGSKSVEERIEWMIANPPQRVLKSAGSALRPGPPELCERCGGLVHDDAQDEGPRCRCDGALRRCREHVDRADPTGEMTFEALADPDPSIERAAAAARRVALGEQRGVAMFGRPGTGKTHVAIASCRLALSRRVSAGYYNVVELVGRVQETYGKDWHAETRSGVIAGVAGREIVVLDDLGKERRSGDIDSIVYELINAIYCSGARLIVCSNLGADAYAERYDEAVRSRVAGTCEIAAVRGEDRRRAV